MPSVFFFQHILRHYFLWRWLQISHSLNLEWEVRKVILLHGIRCISCKVWTAEALHWVRFAHLDFMNEKDCWATNFASLNQQLFLVFHKLRANRFFSKSFDKFYIFCISDIKIVVDADRVNYLEVVRADRFRFKLRRLGFQLWYVRAVKWIKLLEIIW